MSAAPSFDILRTLQGNGFRPSGAGTSFRAMCGRYVLGIPPEDLADFFELSEIRLTYQPRFNVAPTTLIPVIGDDETGSREAVEMRWGLILSGARPGESARLLINARAETVATRPAFRQA